MWNKVRNNICSGWAICTNNSVATGGRIWLLWNPSLFVVNILYITPQTIHSIITMRGSQQKFCFTLVYGYNRAAERGELWKSLQWYRDCVHGPWVVGGDFNNVLHADDMLGGAVVSLADIKPFQDCLHYCELQDTKAIGSFFTWNNKQNVDTLVYSRLDRCLTNDEWMVEFPDSYAYFMPEGTFDHCPCVFYLQGQPKGTQMYQHVRKLKDLKYDLKKLNKGSLGDIENKVKVAKLALFQLQEALITNPIDQNLIANERELAGELITLQKA
ncbi:uncharacterized protein LOC141632685 [Silene latifolia]|uniref:uncharacterized protein LOC141632685 n=1 Tax=Silene latifolia TaxID=37657 RepID=UPI003D779C53